jgi:hypothetical protein
VDYFLLENNNMAGHWLNKPDLNFNLKVMVITAETEVLDKSNKMSALKKESVKGFLSKVKDPAFRKKVVITLRVSVFSFELQTPTKDYKLMSVPLNKDQQKYSKFIKVPEVTKLICEYLVEILLKHLQWCKMVRPDSGYKVFINTETQNYAVKEDHLIIYDDFQSLKEKVGCSPVFATEYIKMCNIIFIYVKPQMQIRPSCVSRAPE